MNSFIILAGGAFSATYGQCEAYWGPDSFAEDVGLNYCVYSGEPESNCGFGNSSQTSGVTLAQSFTACTTGELTSIRAMLTVINNAFPEEGLTMRIFEGEGVAGSLISTAMGIMPTITVNASQLDRTQWQSYWTVIDLSAVKVEIGKVYTIQFDGNTASSSFAWIRSQYESSGYVGGHPYEYTVAKAGFDFYFGGSITPVATEAIYDDLTLTDDTILDSDIRITGVLDLADHNLFTNGHSVTFGCGSGEVAVLAPVASGGIYNGISGTSLSDVIIEHCYEASRAYRLISSPLTTTSGVAPSIKDNWQEGVNNTSLDYAFNTNPNPGYGTHISGSKTGTNGFDATSSGNSSIFYWDGAGLQWSAVGNTDTTTLQAGDPYRLMIRGDRSINLNYNSSGDEGGAVAPKATILRTRGALNIGTYTKAFLGVHAGTPVFIGNPKQAPIDMDLVLQNPANSDFDAVYMYVWDVIGAGGRGSYQVVALPSGGGIANITATSTASQYLQPGEADFLEAVSDDPVLTILETDKIMQTTVTTPYKLKEESTATKNAVTAFVKVDIYEGAEYLEGKGRRDGLVLGFNDDVYSDNVNKYDAIKFFNEGESIAVLNGSNYLSVETRKLPENGDVFPLGFYNYQDRDYVLTVEVSGFKDGEMLLYDAFEDKTYALNGNGKTTIPVFDITDKGADSYYRFEVRYSTENLAINTVVADGFVVYPNPVSQGELFINAGTGVDKLAVTMVNLLGQEVFNDTQEVINNKVTISTAHFAPGVYILKATDDNVSHTQKIIIK